MPSALKTPDIVLAVAAAEMGYLEKKTPLNLDSKQANAGYNNFTKYWRDLFPKFQGSPWCNAFVNWCFIQAFGTDAADKMLCGAITCSAPYYTPTTANCFKKAGRWYTKDPHKGDVIYFKDKTGLICHVGIVLKVDNLYIYTIEGNTSSGNDVVVANGGSVSTKFYSRTNSRIAGFGRPKYDNENSVLTKVQTAVGAKTKVDVAKYYDRTIAGKYRVTASTLNMRSGVNKTVLKTLKNGAIVQCYGYYNKDDKGQKWLYVIGDNTTGYCYSSYLQKV